MLQTNSGGFYFDGGNAGNDNPPQKKLTLSSGTRFELRISAAKPRSHFLSRPSATGPCRGLPRLSGKANTRGAVNNCHCLQNVFQELFQEVARHVVADAGQVRTERSYRLCHALLNTASEPPDLDNRRVPCKILPMMRPVLWKICRRGRQSKFCGETLVVTASWHVEIAANGPCH
jgi:hypothetical protein